MSVYVRVLGEKWQVESVSDPSFQLLFSGDQERTSILPENLPSQQCLLPSAQVMTAEGLVVGQVLCLRACGKGKENLSSTFTAHTGWELAGKVQGEAFSSSLSAHGLCTPLLQWVCSRVKECNEKTSPLWCKRAESGPSATWRAALASGFPEFYHHFRPTAEGLWPIHHPYWWSWQPLQLPAHQPPKRDRKGRCCSSGWVKHKQIGNDNFFEAPACT